MGTELLNAVAQATGMTEAELTQLLLAQVLATAGITNLGELPGAQANVPAAPVAVTCSATAKSTGKPCTLKARENGVCHVHGANPAPSAKVTQAVRTTVPAKVTIGFRHNGELARRSAYVVAEALGLGNDYGVLKDLRVKGKDEVLALLAERGIAADVVPASKLA